MTYLDEEKPSLDELMHYGVLGMKWGVRKDRGAQGVSRRTNRDAKKDANEFARAKMFYGEGAGTRRKLIKATVEAKSKKDPTYKKAFDHHLGNQDFSKRASQARSERKRKDAVKGTAKTVRGVHRSLTGGFGSVTLVSSILASGYILARRNGIDKVILNHAKDGIDTIKAKRKGFSREGYQFLKNNGLIK